MSDDFDVVQEVIEEGLNFITGLQELAGMDLTPDVNDFLYSNVKKIFSITGQMVIVYDKSKKKNKQGKKEGH